MLEQSRDCAAAADELERIVLELGGKPGQHQFRR